VARHDITADAIPLARYDLIHARLVLSHLPQRRDVLVRLIEALRPGGWLVIEDFCHAFERGSEPTDPGGVTVGDTVVELRRRRYCPPWCRKPVGLVSGCTVRLADGRL
jgi:SAM-dependent methyltransferase